DLFPADNSPFSGLSPRSLTVVGNTVFFQDGSETTGIQLWKTDGTAAGTTLVKEIEAPNTEFTTSLRNMTAQNGILLFSADDGAHGLQPWRSDGPTLGTKMIAD